VIAISRQAGNSGRDLAFKTAYKSNWGKMPELLRRIEGARASGVDCGKSVSVQSRVERPRCLPAAVGFAKAAWKKCWRDSPDPTQRERIRKDMDDANATTWKTSGTGSGGGDGVMLSSVLNPELRKYEGMTLTQIGQRDGQGSARCRHGFRDRGPW